MNVRKKNGDVYEPTSLKDFQRSLQRYLNDKSAQVNILQDQEFSKSREVLLAKKRELVQQHAKGNRPQACRELHRMKNRICTHIGTRCQNANAANATHLL